MKGIIVAGGSGTRLSPLTKIISKSLLPVYDKPMIYYPLSVLMQAGINEILIITTPNDKSRFIELLGDGSQLGLSLSYIEEPAPKGIAQAFILGEEFIGSNHVALILGDNIFCGYDLLSLISNAMERETGATIFGYFVHDPERFGVVEFNDTGKVVSIEEKPINPKTNYAVPGLYFYDHRVVEIAKELKPSERGELEITDINKAYLEMDELHVELMGEGFSWIDTGTHFSLFEAALYVKEIEKHHNLKIGCIEEIAYKKGLISREQLKSLAKPFLKSDYGKHLMKLVNIK
ncbi:glucose-1-phosphate thymidylyltransferase RfbA [Bacillus sp. FJAT-29790]|uniref:glucose-1-phosphate thymidylyltransferase RfbA n=1 Tax=Bacillus sp. FJAT-29790 TaxID=1895002 RepID=UPI001C249BA3|nr:glucose-1-phosphate thymidylyltransferase RfbA [Bacillus sp. FJAT-29790]MBU8879966.1 glucose-1-phosphate thymidylyltransferase RfbA [Bacillus sp. FJAT-29790]